MEKKNVLTKKELVSLMLACIATQSKENIKVARIPVNYKQIIENILCAENRWKEMFSSLIDVDDYFDDHFSWELYFSIELRKVLNEFGKKVDYSFEFDEIHIEFTQEEIDNITSQFPEEIISKMIHFTSLVTDYIYTRQFQEKFTDYSARAVKKMHDLEQERYNDSMILTRKKGKKGIFSKLC